MKNYENEARSRCGNAEACREHEQKTKSCTEEKSAGATEIYFRGK